MSLNYSSWVSTIANLTAYDQTDTNFVQILPSAIDYAEGRLYSEMNLLGTVVRDSSLTLSNNSRTFTLPVPAAGAFQVITEINVLTPVGSTTANGTRNTLGRSSLKFLDFLYPTETAPSTPSVPRLFCMIDPFSIAVGPAPDANYRVEVVGDIQPNPLSASNTTTYLTTYLPELFVAASMVFMNGYMKNFGSQADDPRGGQSWEQQYQLLLAANNSQQNRLRYMAVVNENYPVSTT